MNPKRHNNKWTINEILSLQREYELLEMSIKQIAKKHERLEDAILWKIEKEGFVVGNTVKEEIDNFLKMQHSQKKKSSRISLKKNVVPLKISYR
jgi:hypothetical protein